MRLDEQKDWNIVRGFMQTLINIKIGIKGITPLAVLNIHGIKRRSREELYKYS